MQSAPSLQFLQEPARSLSEGRVFVLTVVWDFLALWKRSVGVTTSLLAVEVPALRKVREERGTHDSDVGGEARKAGPPAPHGIYSNL